MTSETLVSDFSATIPAMIVSLRHFFGWLVTIFRPREDLVLDFLPSYLLYYHEDRTHLGLRLAARFLNNSVPRVSREFDANGHGSGTFFVDGFVWELVRSEVRDLSDQHCDELSLNREKDGQHVYANVGQRIVICLQTIGGVTTAHRRYLPKQSDSTEQSLQKGRTREVPRRFTISLQLLRERPKSAYPTPIQTPLLRL